MHSDTRRPIGLHSPAGDSAVALATIPCWASTRETKPPIEFPATCGRSSPRSAKNSLSTITAVSSSVQQDQRRSRAAPVVCQLHSDTLSTSNPPVTSPLGYVTIVEELPTDLRVARRVAAVPPIRYPQALPISQHIGEIATAIRDHQVVVIAGETGSGKTTQIPKICLERGRGVRGTIGHTQPRRLAARTVAERIAEELDVPIGGVVGWKVRFTDRVSEHT